VQARVEVTAHERIMGATGPESIRLLGHQALVIDEGNRMPAKRELTMRQIRQMLRLARDG